MTTRILEGNVLDTLTTIAPGSVDCVITSPPYWMLRSYLPKGHALKPLELGSEATPDEYIANMVRVFALARETMADHATCWLNIGDSYASGGGAWKPQNAPCLAHQANTTRAPTPAGLDSGNLCLIPWRLALALQNDGWLVRSVIVWHKPAPMPSSVAGWRWVRCRVKVKEGTMRRADAMAHRPRLPVDGRGGISQAVAHGDVAQWSDCPGCDKCRPHGGYVLRKGNWRPTSSWEPVLLLAKKPGYFCDGEAVKQPAAAATISRNEYTRIIDDPDEQFAVAHDHETLTTTANLRDVWTIAAEPLREKHYAAFPSELVYRCLKAGTSARGYCPSCGMPWCRVVEQSAFFGSAVNHDNDAHVGKHEWRSAESAGWTPAKTIDWRPTCSCPESATPRPGLVLDPFAGSGRTLRVAQQLGLDGIGCELNPSYVEMSRRLIRADAPLFNGAAP